MLLLLIAGLSALTLADSETPTKNVFHLREERPKHALELMIAADYTMVAFYGDKLNDFLEDYANILNGIFQDPSLETPIEVTLVKKVIFRTDVFKAKNMNDLETKFTVWNQKQNIDPYDHCNPNHYDHALLLTRTGDCHGVNCHQDGASFHGLCTLKSTTTARDRGLTSVLTAAFEIAYSFGIPMDSIEKGCYADKYIMSIKQHGAGVNAEEWSKCSSDALAKILRDPKTSCLRNLPKNRPRFTLAGKKYNRDMQCHFKYGPGYKSCTNLESICNMLWCAYPKGVSAPNNCVSTYLPAADGTFCGKNQWCIHGKCVSDGTAPSIPVPVNGGWSSWGDYKTCPVPCGGGLQRRERTCTNPKPANGGKSCEGEDKGHYRACNTFKCKKKIDPRNLQCLKQKQKLGYYHIEADPCHLNCYIKPHSSIYRKFGNVADGIHCDPKRSTNDVCVNGKCENVGCDGILHSGAVKDRCGVCNGDGTSCQLHTGRNMNKFSSPGEHLVVTIPAEARNIKVKELGDTVWGSLGFKLGDSKKMNKMRTPEGGTDINVDGFKFHFVSTNAATADEITESGRIDKPLSIYYFDLYGMFPSKGIEWEYLGKPNGSPKQPTFKWVPKKWSKCSRLCAGGVRKRELICIRTDDKSQVSKKSCRHLEEIPSLETCNSQHCPPEWHYTEWTKCSKSCGTGTQTRQLICTVVTVKGRKTRADAKCPAVHPTEPKKRTCNAVMCPAKWHVLSGYGECSARCGDGKKRKDIACQHTTKDGKVVKTHPIECFKEKRPKGVAYCYEKPCKSL